MTTHISAHLSQQAIAGAPCRPPEPRGCVHPMFGTVVLVDESQTLVRAEAHERREPVGVAHHQRGPGLLGQLRAEQEALAPFCCTPHGRAPVDGLESLRVVCPSPPSIEKGALRPFFYGLLTVDSSPR